MTTENTGEASKTNGDSDDQSNKTNEEFVPKAEHDKVVGELSKLKQDLEDVRMEVLTPDYLNYLDNKDKKDDKKVEQSNSNEVDFEKLTPRQAYELAKKEAREMVDEIKKNQEEDVKSASRRDVAIFARSHDDYSTYRPIMYGLSTDPKNKDCTLQELYDMAKEHVSRIHTSATESDKAKSRHAEGEKPNTGSGSFKKSKTYTPALAAEEAWDEVVGGNGLPPAV